MIGCVGGVEWYVCVVCFECGEAWKHFDWEHADFVVNMQNVRLGLSTDGFNPYIQASFSPYSCWPIIVTSYNLPPEMCMTKPYMFLSCVIQGPHLIQQLVLIFIYNL